LTGSPRQGNQAGDFAAPATKAEFTLCSTYWTGPSFPAGIGLTSPGVIVSSTLQELSALVIQWDF
jgi:hypothetical protein